VTDQFDPGRHRVWAVDVAYAWRAYVVAETAEDAEVIADVNGDGRDSGLVRVDHEVHQVTAPSSGSALTMPVGAARWGRRNLTVNEALLLIREPRPAPPVIASDQLRHLGDWDWVRLAAATDSRRPVLRAVQVCGRRAVATDGRRLHLAPVSCPDGLWDAELMQPVVGEYPSYEPVLVRDGPTWEVADLASLWSLLQVARPGTVELPCGLGRCTLDAGQLAEALLGAATAERILLSASAGDTAIRFDFPDLRRTAVLARMGRRHPSADLSRFIRPIGPE
jgi:hypothetical protein